MHGNALKNGIQAAFFSTLPCARVTLASILLGKLRLAFLRSLQSFEPSVLPVQLPFAAVSFEPLTSGQQGQQPPTTPLHALKNGILVAFFSTLPCARVTLASILLGKLRLAFLRSLQSFEPSVLPVQLPFAAVKSIRRCRSIHSIFAPQEPKSWHQLISPICHTKYFDTFWIEKNGRTL